MKYGLKSKIKDSPEDVAMQEEIRFRANYSLSILGKSFVYHGSGRFLNIRVLEEEELPKIINVNL